MKIRFAVAAAFLTILFVLSSVVLAEGEENGEFKTAYLLSYAELCAEKGDFHGIPLPSGSDELISFEEESSDESKESDSEENSSETVDSSAESAFSPETEDITTDVFYGEAPTEDPSDDGGSDPEQREKEKAPREKKLPHVTGAEKTVLSRHPKGNYIYSAFDGTGEPMVLKFSLPEDFSRADLNKKSLGIGLYLSGEASDGGLHPMVKVKLGLVGDDGEYTAELYVATGVPVRITVDTSDVEKDFEPLYVTLQLENGDAYEADAVRTTYPYLCPKGKFTFLRDNGLSYLSVLQGDLTLYHKKLSISFGKEDVILAAGALGEDNTRVKYLSVGAEKGTASVLVSRLSDFVASATNAMTVSKSDGRGLFRVADVSGVSVTLKGESGKRIVLDELSVLDTLTPTSSDYGAVIGTMNISENTLHIEGRLDEEIVKSYMMNHLGVYMVSAVGEGEPVFVGRGSIATRISLDVELDEYPHAASDCKFYLAVSDSDGEVLRLSEPRFAVSSSGKVAPPSMFALHNVDPVSVYEVGASSVMVDVDIKMLTDTVGVDPVTVSRGGFVFTVNSDYLRELDTDMEFYHSSGVSVYLRLVCSGALTSKLNGEALTLGGEGAEEYLLRGDSAEAVNMYLAVVSYLCSRYPNISSVALSSGINAAKYTGHDGENVSDYAAKTALLIRLVGGVANSAGDGISVTVPFVPAEMGDYPEEILAALISEELSRLGQIPWVLMYTDSEAKLPKVSENIIHAQRLNGTVASAASVYCWAPEKITSSLVKDYVSLCEDTEGRQERVIFLSGKDLSEPIGRKMLERLKFEMKSENSFLLDSEIISSESFDENKFTGSYTLWDFTSSHSTLGWTAFYGIDSVSTVPVDLAEGWQAGRVLRSVTESTHDRTAGIVLRRLDKTVSFAEMPYVEFEFMCTSKTPVQVTFVFGKGENRAEYTLPETMTPDEDGIYRGICDLSRFPPRSELGYIGVIIYSDKVAQFDLSSVKVYSGSLSDDEMEEIFNRESEETEKRELPVKRITVAAFVLVFVLLVTVRTLGYARQHDRQDKSVSENFKKERNNRIR